MHGSKTRRTHRLGSVSSGQPAGSNERLAFEPLEERRMLASTPELLADLGVVNDLRPGDFTEAGGVVFFTGQTSGHNESELWKTDGTAEGTLPIDIYYDGDGDVMDLAEFNGQLYFGGRDYDSYALWKSDGTEAGTVPVKRLNYYHRTAAGFNQLINANGTLYFFADDPLSPYSYSPFISLWKSDGTSEGTVKLKELPNYPGTGDEGLLAVGSGVFFEGANGALWHSDGTPEGTVEIRKLSGPSLYGSVESFVNVNGTLYFTAPKSGFGTELWKSDGTTDGTVLVKDVRPGPESSDLMHLTNVGGTLYFMDFDNTNGHRLWKSDGTDSGTARVKQFPPDSQYPYSVVSFAEKLFLTFGGWATPKQLWVSDGTEAGTHSVSDVPALSEVVAYSGQIYLRTWDTNELWSTDGTPAGSHFAMDLPAGIRVMGAGSKLFLAGMKAVGLSDGTPQGTQLLDPISNRLVGGGAWYVTQVNDVAYFGAWDDRGFELWRTDGTAVNTRIVKDILPGSGSAGVRMLTNVNGTLYFVASDGLHGKELWRTDGTDAGTRMVIDLTIDDTEFGELVNVAGTLYFTTVDDGANRLWRTDGTAAGTVGITSLPARSLVVSGAKLYFFAELDDYEVLWQTDTTKRVIRIVTQIPLSRTGSRPALLTVAGDRVYYVTEGEFFDSELWVSGGVGIGTRRVTLPGDDLIWPRRLTNVGGTLYFTARDCETYALWKTDGTEAGTQRIKPIRGGGGESRAMKLFHGDVYFADSDGLWKSDGTEAGTVMISPPVGQNSFPGIESELVEFQDRLYFVAHDRTRGEGLWRTDGTAAGTEFVMDLSPAEHQQLSVNLEAVLDVLIFNADGSRAGFDPWIIRSVPPHVVSRQLFYNDSAFDGGSAAANAADDGAIAPDKSAYLPGSGRSTTANVSSYVHGINGVMIDIAGLEGELTADDFTFRVGTNASSPENWALAPAPLEVVVRAGAGANGSDRVTITWANGAIKNTWLQVTVQGNDAAGGFNTNTGLAESDVFYFGNRVGDTFEGATAVSTATTTRDELAARFGIAGNQTLTSLLDFNRDGVVSAVDQLIARQNVGVLRMLEIEEIAEVLVASRGASDTQAGLAFAFALGDSEEADDAPPAEPWRRVGRRSK